MLYLSPPSGGAVRDAMVAGRLGCMTTPKQGNALPPGAWYGADNGRFGRGWPGTHAWIKWLEKDGRPVRARAVPVGHRPRRRVRPRRNAR